MWKWETKKQSKGVIVVIHDMLEHHEYYTDMIFRFRESGFHVITGDLPGHGQTTRMNKGHISDFDQYIERVEEWVNVARLYNLPTFIIGQGLGGLIALEASRLNYTTPDGIILINPLLNFKQSFINRKNTVRTSIKTTSDVARFDPGIKFEYFTQEEEYLERYINDELLVRKVSFHWYRTVMNQMKHTSDHLDMFPNVPVLSLFSHENNIIEPFLTVKHLKQIQSEHFEVHVIKNIEHAMFQRENIEFPIYLIKNFLNTNLYKIGIID